MFDKVNTHSLFYIIIIICNAGGRTQGLYLLGKYSIVEIYNNFLHVYMCVTCIYECMYIGARVRVCV